MARYLRGVGSGTPSNSVFGGLDDLRLGSARPRHGVARSQFCATRLGSSRGDDGCKVFLIDASDFPVSTVASSFLGLGSARSASVISISACCSGRP